MRCLGIAVVTAMMALAAESVRVKMRDQALPPLSVGLQAHSWNDLRLIPQGLAKGVRWFKFDPHFAAPAACRSAGVSPPIGFEAAGCLVLTHDPADTSVGDTGLFGLADLVALVDTLTRAASVSNVLGSQFAPVAPQNGGAIDVTFALCFKAPPPSSESESESQRERESEDVQSGGGKNHHHLLLRDNGSATSRGIDGAGAFSELVAWAVGELNGAANYSGGGGEVFRVRFVMDGSGDPVMAPSWPATLIPSHPKDMAADKGSCLYQNTTPSCQGRDVLDAQALPLPLVDPVEWAAPLCGAGWGRFSSVPHPLLVWEPSDTPTISLVVSALGSCNANCPQNTVRFAFNTDPLYFRTLAAPAVSSSGGRAVFSTINGAENSNSNSGESQETAAIPARGIGKTAALGNGTVVEIFLDPGSRELLYGAVGVDRSVDVKFPDRERYFSGEVVGDGEVLPVGLSVPPGDDAWRIAVSGVAARVIVCLATGAMDEKCVMAGVGRVDLGRGISADISAVELPGNRAAVFRLGGNSSDPSCAVPLTIHTLSLDTGEPVSAPGEACVSTDGTFEGGSIAAHIATSSSSHDSTSERVKESNGETPEETTVGVSFEALAVLSSFSGGLVAVVVDATGGAAADQSPSKSDSKWTIETRVLGRKADGFSGDNKTRDGSDPVPYFGRGNAPSVALSASGAVTVVAGGAYCFNSDFHNKRSHPRVCDADPFLSAGAPKNAGVELGSAIGYWIAGSIAAFEASVQESQASSGYITPCDARVLHGTLASGSSPSVAIGYSQGSQFDGSSEVFPQSNKASFLIISAEGFKHGTVETGGCGFPAPSDAQMLYLLDVTGIMASLESPANPESDRSAFSTPDSRKATRFSVSNHHFSKRDANNHRGRIVEKVEGKKETIANRPTKVERYNKLGGEGMCAACVAFFDALDAAVLEAGGVDDKVAMELSKICPIAKVLFLSGDGSEAYCENVIYTYVPDLISSATLPSQTICRDLGACSSG